MFAVAKSWPIIVDNANLIASANNMLIGASFAPIVSMKIVTCWLDINKNEETFFKDCSFGGPHFQAAKYTVNNIFVDWILK